MAGYRVRAQLGNVKPLLDAMAGMKRALRTRILKAAVNAGARLILQDARTRIHSVTDLLRQSLAVKVKVYRGSGVVVGIVGPRTGFQKGKGRGAARRLTAFGKKLAARFGAKTNQHPAAYAASVEKGHKRGKGRSAAPPHPFLGPAFRSTKGAVEATIAARIWQGIRAQAGKP